MEDLVLQLTENTSLFEVILIVVLGLIFYFKLKDNTDQKIDKLETTLNNRIDKLEFRIDKLDDRIDKVETKIDQVNMRLDNLYHELFKKKSA